MIAIRTMGVVSVCNGSGEQIAVPPTPLALLVYLAAARPAGPHRRDQLVTLLYPDADEAHGRQALRQLLAELRAIIGPESLANGDRHTAGLNRGFSRSGASSDPGDDPIRAGALDAAIEQPERPLANPGYVSARLLQVDPLYAPSATTLASRHWCGGTKTEPSKAVTRDRESVGAAT